MRIAVPPLFKLIAVFSAIVFILLPVFSPAFAEDEPALPAGLSDQKISSEEPDLPAGLSSQEILSEEPDLPDGLSFGQESPQHSSDDEPSLPSGLGGSDENLRDKSLLNQSRDRLPFDISGFWEIRSGMRLQEDRHQKDASITETRFQLEIEKTIKEIVLKSTTDFLYDRVPDNHHIKLEQGRGFIDQRELNVLFRPSDFIDIKAGRQVLTWGMGDLLFINDLFPKDWNSFFIGRDDEYLKSPSDAVKVSIFGSMIKLDMIYTPRFDPNRFIDGRRISYYSPMTGEITGAVVNDNRQNDWFEDDETAFRLYTNLSGYELAFYGYQGFWKDPVGFDPATGKAVFPELSVYGASARRVISEGIGALEMGWYNSEDDSDGGDPNIPNSELRLLIGYEQEIAKDFTAGMQYYLEHLLDYGEYKNTLPPGIPKRDMNRHVLTLRLTKLLMSQNLILSLFTYYSPSDQDAYIKPKATYKINDYWIIETGGNCFLGEKDHSFFGQFKDATNWYAGIRLSY